MSQPDILDTLPTIGELDKHALRSEWEYGLEQIEGIDCSTIDGIAVINNKTTELFATLPNLDPLRSIFGPSQGEQDKVIRAIHTHTFPPEEEVIEKYGDDAYEKLWIVSHAKEQFSRQYILNRIEAGFSFGLEDWELEVLKTSSQVSGDVDRMCMDWRWAVAKNPLNELSTTLGFTNRYTIIRNDTHPEEVTYAVAFQDHTEKIAGAWHLLAKKLFQYGDADANSMAIFFESYAQAMESRDVTQVESLWKKADEDWMLVTGRVQPIPPHEWDYYDPMKLRIFPDYRLAIQLNNEFDHDIELTRQGIVDYLNNHYLDRNIHQRTIHGIINVQIYSNMIDATIGGTLGFQPVGQSLPNENEIRMRLGSKTFLNLEATVKRWDTTLNLARDIFEEDINLFERIDLVEDAIKIWIAGHEIGEPYLNDEETVTKVLGEYMVGTLNEDAATLVATTSLTERPDRSFDMMLNHAIYSLGVYLRYIAVGRGKDNQLQPYYEGLTLRGLKRMLDTDFIYQESGTGNWRIDIEQLDRLYTWSVEDLETQVTIADTGAGLLATEYLPAVGPMEHYPPMADLITKVQKANK